MFVKHLRPFLGYLRIENERNRQIIVFFFLSSRGITVKNCSIVPRTKLDPDIIMINQYIYKFHFSMYNLWKKMGENCWWTDRLTAQCNMPKNTTK